MRRSNAHCTKGRGREKHGGAQPMKLQHSRRACCAKRSAVLDQAMSTASDTLKAIYSHPMHFDADDIARSRSHAGDGTRLRRVMTRLLQGATSPVCSSKSCGNASMS